MKRTLLSVLLLTLAGAAVAPASWAGGPPPWAPAHGWHTKHHYTYYPDGEVYYANDARRWYWLDDGNWRSGSNLPAAFQAYVRIGGVTIDLGTDRPYVEHTYVVEHYGGKPPRYWQADREYRDHERDDRDDDQGDGDRDRDRDRGDDHGKHDH